MMRFRGVYPAYDDSILLVSLKNLIMPEIGYTSVKIPLRPGMLEIDKTHNARVIEATYQLNGKSEAANARLAEQLAIWAESVATGAIILDEQKDRYYLGKLTNTTPVDYAEPWPEVTLTFTCANPYGFATTPKQAPVGEMIIYGGSVDVWPVITFTADQDMASVQWSDGERILRLDDQDYTIRAGHTIVVDNANRVITDNDESVMAYMTLLSDWLYMKRGVNTFTGTGGIVEWRDVYL